MASYYCLYCYNHYYYYCTSILDYYRLLHYYRKDTQKSASASGPSDKDPDPQKSASASGPSDVDTQKVGIGIWAEQLDVRMALSRLVVRPPSLKALR